MFTTVSCSISTATMAPAFLQRACVAWLLALTSPPSFSNNLLKRTPTTTATTTWPYFTTTASAFLSASPPIRRGIDGTVRDFSRRCTSSPARSRRPSSRRHATPTTTTPPSLSGRRRSRLQGGAVVVVAAGAASAAAAGAGGPLTRLSVATTLVDRRERRVVGTPSRPLPPPPGAAASALGSTGPRDLSEAPVEVIDSMDTYFKVMEENANEIVVVKVFAGFCRACKAFDRKYKTLALDYEEAGANIKFFEMDWMQTRDLCKSLQVKKLPHLELYAGKRGRLESFVCGPSKAGMLKEKLDALLADPSDPSLGAAPPPLSPVPLSPS